MLRGDVVMLNPSTIAIMASSLLLCLGGCNALNKNRTCVSELSNSAVPAENRISQETPVDASHTVATADLVIKNTKVVTIDKDNPRAQAVAFKGQTIIAVASNKSIEKYIKEGVTEVIDAQSRLVVPGFSFQIC
ncbi:MAG: hypothetical protein ACYS19_10385 [Planctomycetota bacterium]|jgi:pyrroline-5-carboxylate reductase